MKTITLSVGGMHCKSCEMLIADALEDLSGVKEVSASHDSDSVSIEFDESEVTEDSLKQVIRDEGYSVN